ncbi:putative GTPase [Sulfuritortus calidifontis]|uniref:Putative GTPase n=1 Tax=Sulfuritortus calidifontis TaxID=1914471 RepID=A0A4R3K054_9PROT|nr:cyclic 2,3-diphosphoglycerate synthase [Sulfuritortus calidifontis]TCS73791.1 putative GTPase [Sulfuritortus calidifontis]
MTMETLRKSRILILGAAGRDFHNFNVVYRLDPTVEVVAFTAAQIPGIAGRRYPASLAGPRYPQGIPIVDESELEAVCRRERVDQVVFAYSDVPHEHVMHLASRALACGADFLLLGPARTQIQAARLVIAISAVRTGCGKSQASRYLSHWLKQQGLRVAVLRHPMPYGDLEQEAVQRFADRSDLTAACCTVEEREEYEPHIALGHVVYAGVDYGRIAEAAAAEADLLLWEGGNNDFPFLKPDLHIVLTDPLRPGHELSHHPGEAVLRMADVAVVMKTDSAEPVAIHAVEANIRRLNPGATIVRAASPVTLDDAAAVRGKKVVVVEDGPTVTHGGMAWGAGLLAAQRAGAEVLDPRPWAAPEIAAVFERYPHIGPVLPAVGYSEAQLAALAQTLDRAEVAAVIAATPIDLAALIRVNKPIVRARYEYAEVETPGLLGEVAAFLRRAGLSVR